MAVTSERLASEMAESIDALLPELTYRLQLEPSGKLSWTYSQNVRGEAPAVTRTLYTEPHTTVWRRLSTWLMSLLPIEGQM